MILDIVNKKVNIIVYPSPQDSTVDMYFGKVEKTYILVVANRKTKNLITVRNMRTKEKLVYEGELKL